MRQKGMVIPFLSDALLSGDKRPVYENRSVEYDFKKK